MANISDVIGFTYNDDCPCLHSHDILSMFTYGEMREPIAYAVRGSLFDIVFGFLVAARIRSILMVSSVRISRSLLAMLHVIQDICGRYVRHGYYDKVEAELASR
jgi:hypothetical protein